MFRHILLPTDGSARSESAVDKGIELARALGVRVAGLNVIPRFQWQTYRADMLEETRAEYEHDSKPTAAAIWNSSRGRPACCSAARPSVC